MPVVKPALVGRLGKLEARQKTMDVTFAHIEVRDVSLRVVFIPQDGVCIQAAVCGGAPVGVGVFGDERQIDLAPGAKHTVYFP